MSSKSTKSNGGTFIVVNGKKPKSAAPGGRRHGTRGPTVQASAKAKVKKAEKAEKLAVVKAKKELTGEEVAAQNFVEHNGAALNRPLPPKKRLWDAINVVCDRLSNGVEYCESAADLVLDLRRRDLITRRETQRLSRKYKLHLGGLGI